MTEQTKWTLVRYKKPSGGTYNDGTLYCEGKNVGELGLDDRALGDRIVAQLNALQGIANPSAVAGLVEAAWAAAEELERLSDVRGHLATRRAWHGLIDALAALEQEQGK